MKNHSESRRESTIDEQLATPTIARFLDRHPGLRDRVADVLRAASDVRQSRPAALPDPPAAKEHDPERSAAESELADAVAALETIAAKPDPDHSAAGAALSRIRRAIAELRVLGHRFDPPRPLGERHHRAALVRALRQFRSALDALVLDARRAGTPRLPWRIELATDIDPTTPADDLELAAPGLPHTPAADLPCGERCLLTGRPFAVDSRRAPVPRYRSLDSHSAALTPWAHDLAVRIITAIGRLGPAHDDESRRLLELAPWLAEPRIATSANPSFVRLGLLDVPSLAVAANNTLLAHAEQPLLGCRGLDGDLLRLGARDPAAALLDGVVPGHGWITFDEVRGRALGLAHGLEVAGVRRGSRLATIAGSNRPELFISDLACVFADLVSVGILDTLTDDAVLDIAATAEVETVLTDPDNAERFTSDRAREHCPALTTVVVLDRSPGPPPAADGLRVLAFDELVTPVEDIDPTWTSGSGIGPSTPILHDDEDGARTRRTLEISDDGDADVFTLLFTSGTTGRAKGVVIHRRQWLEVMHPKGGLWPHVEVSYQPAALGADRTVVWRTFAAGGRIGYGSRGGSLLADIRAVRPTVLEAPPAILNTLYAEFRRAAADPDLDRQQLAAVKRRMRDDLGGRLAFLATGGAASEPAVREVLAEVLGLPVAEGYGTTETGTIATDGRLKPEIEFRLVDVPDMGFTQRDHPHPRGELAVRTPRTSARYFAAGASDRAAFTDDGFFLTGDIVELVGDRRIRIIGRRKQFFKLAGAEFVYPDLLERHFMTSDVVRAVFVTGLATEHAVVAVVVPTDPATTAGEILAALRRVAHRVGLRAFETPIAVVLEPPVDGELPWSAGNGLLTPSLKPNRRALETHYAEKIRDAYARATRPLDEAVDDDDTLEDRQIARVRYLTANLLGLDPSEIDLDHSFAEHGGGSLAAMELVLRLRQLLPPGRARAVTDDPAGLTERPLLEIAGWLGGAEPTATATVPRGEARRPKVPATDSRREPSRSHQRSAERANRDAAWCALPDELPAASPGGDILLTGATGFLGVHMACELAASLDGDQRLFALVRAADHSAARTRLIGALRAAGLDTRGVAAGPADDGAVVALAGSLEIDGFGLDDEELDMLARSVGLIHHVGAAVSFEPSYEGVREANVGGTRRVLELAVTGRRKAVHFVSSLNVAYLIEMCGARPALEATPLPPTLPPDVVRRSLGYAVSKWVGERMVQGMFAAARGGLRLSISRPALITWSTGTGFANEGDWFTRVLRSCLEVRRIIGPPEAGVPRFTPRSPTTVGGLDLVPVDFVARALGRLGELTRSDTLPPRDEPDRVATFHVSNLAPDERGLVTVDRLMDMLVSADLAADHAAPVMHPLPLADWLLEVEARGAPALPVLDMLVGMNPARPRTRAEAFAAAMAVPVPGGPIECPGFDQELVDRFVRRTLASAVPST